MPNNKLAFTVAYLLSVIVSLQYVNQKGRLLRRLAEALVNRRLSTVPKLVHTNPLSLEAYSELGGISIQMSKIPRNKIMYRLHLFFLKVYLVEYIGSEWYKIGHKLIIDQPPTKVYYTIFLIEANSEAPGW